MLKTYYYSVDGGGMCSIELPAASPDYYDHIVEECAKFYFCSGYEGECIISLYETQDKSEMVYRAPVNVSTKTIIEAKVNTNHPK